MKPINLIMPFAGYSLVDLVELKELKDNHKINKQQLENGNKNYNEMNKILNSLPGQFKNGFYNLVMGIYKMHQNRIVSRDIKMDNITVNYNSRSGKLLMRHIDFGLAENLTPEYITHYSNIKIQGTMELIPPEFFIIFNLYALSYYPDSNKMKHIMDEIGRAHV